LSIVTKHIYFVLLTPCPHLLAYCTGLLLARRVLKIRDLDQEYEGNVEVKLKQIFKFILLAVFFCDIALGEQLSICDDFLLSGHW
jgi:hypothetical protein